MAEAGNVFIMMKTSTCSVREASRGLQQGYKNSCAVKLSAGND